MQQHKYIFYLFGENISSSFSPAIHNYLFNLKNLKNCHYQCFESSQSPKLQLLNNNKQLGGLSLTIPFKKYFTQNSLVGTNKIISEYKGEFSKQEGIINTIIKKKTKKNDENYKYIGHNTDLWAIKKLLDPIFQQRKRIQKMNSLILGAGATSQTFCYYLNNNPQQNSISLFNRTYHKIQSLEKKYKKIVSKTSTQFNKISLVVNTLPTTVLKQNFEKISQFFKNHIFESQGKVVYFDVNYRDHQNICLRMLKEIVKGNIEEILGLDMLIYQAIEQNRLFVQGLKLLESQLNISDEQLLQKIKIYIKQ